MEWLPELYISIRGHSVGVRQLLEFLKKQWMVIGIVGFSFWGYCYPQAGGLAGNYLSWLVGTLMFMMGMGIGFSRLRKRMNSWPQNAVATFICYLAAPLLALGLGMLFFRNQPDIFVGFILVGTTSTTLSSCIVYTRLAGGDEALALWLSVTSSFLCSFISPVLLKLFLGTSVSVPVGMMINRLLFVLLLPLSAGLIARAFLGEKRVAPFGNVLTRGCAVIILTVIMVAVAEGRNLLASWQIMPVLASAVFLHLALLAAAELSSRRLGFPREERIAILFCSAQKTLQIPTYLAVQVLQIPGAALAPVIFHIFQLILDSFLTSYFSSRKP